MHPILRTTCLTAALLASALLLPDSSRADSRDTRPASKTETPPAFAPDESSDFVIQPAGPTREPVTPAGGAGDKFPRLLYVSRSEGKGKTLVLPPYAVRSWVVDRSRK